MNTEEFDYAHGDTSRPERESRTLKLNICKLPQSVESIRAAAFARQIPISSDETLAFLNICVEMAKPKNILEIGTAVGVSGICMLEHCAGAHLTTIEINPDFAAEAKNNFAASKLSDRVTLICDDAQNVLPTLPSDGFDFIFLDGAKVQYIKYLPELKRTLCASGCIFADDVLLYGWVNGEVETPKKRRTLVAHIREYIEAVTHDDGLYTSVVDVGDGVALSIKLAGKKGE